MNWESFVPDLIGSAVTGVLVGVIVLGAERRVSNRAIARAVDKAQTAAVQESRLLLEAEFLFRGTSLSSLKPADHNLERLRAVIREVPPGESTEPDLLFQLVSRTLRSADRLNVYADALASRIEAHTIGYGALKLPLEKAIIVDLQMAATRRQHALWTHSLAQPGFPPEFFDAFQSDSDLNDLVTRYLFQRKGTNALRRGFAVADEYLSSQVWAAEREWAAAGDGRLLDRLQRGRRKQRAIARAINVAQTKAEAVLVAANARVG